MIIIIIIVIIIIIINGSRKLMFVTLRRATGGHYSHRSCWKLVILKAWKQDT
jgi:hypothetical protein